MTSKNNDVAANDTDNGKDTGAAKGSEGGAASKVTESLEAARARAAEAYDVARTRTSAAFDSARETASSATKRTADGIDANPMVAVVGGLALGAVAAVFLPKTKKEEELFGAVGQRIADTARQATQAAREAGKQKLDEIGINADSARQRASELVGSSAGAAVDAVKGGKA